MSRLLEEYDYAAAKSELESFFWTELADNYLEMCKQRLYGEASPGREAAVYTVYRVLGMVLQLFAPFFPYITEEIYQKIFRDHGNFKAVSIHLTDWPEAEAFAEDDAIQEIGAKLVEIATAVRRFKSDHNLPLGCELRRLKLAVVDQSLAATLRESIDDLISVTRARSIEVNEDKEESIEIEL
jgi:valyl-tRNA synthetase